MKTVALRMGYYTNIKFNHLKLIRTADASSLARKNNRNCVSKESLRFRFVKSLAGVNCKNCKFQQMRNNFFVSTENLQD